MIEKNLQTENLSTFELESKNIDFEKKEVFGSSLIIVDGIWGCGKSLLIDLLAAAKSTEAWRHDEILDTIPILRAFGKITKESSKYIIKQHIDQLTYNYQLSRELNFRLKDKTCVLRSRKGIDYIISLISQAPKELEVIRKASEMTIPIMTHMSTFNNDAIYEALGARAKTLIVIRNPIYMIEHWVGYIDRCGTDPREFTPSITNGKDNVPWFAANWANEYTIINSTEKSIKSIKELYSMLLNQIGRCGNKKIQIVCFDDLILNTDHSITKIADYLQIEIDVRNFAKRKRKNKVPRNSEHLEIGYASDQWRRGVKGNKPSEVDEYMKKMKNKVSSNYIEILGECIEIYNTLKQNYCSIVTHSDK